MRDENVIVAFLRFIFIGFALVGIWYVGTTLALAQFGLTMEQAKAYASVERAMPEMKGGL